jgi:hypothetical protein
MNSRIPSLRKLGIAALVCVALCSFIAPAELPAQSSANYSIAFDLIDNGGVSSTSVSTGYRSRAFIGQSAVRTYVKGTTHVVSSGAGCAFCESQFTVGIDAAILPSMMRLYQNYPNPFNPVTTIGYVLEREAMVQLAIYNLLGERIAVIVDEQQPPGEYHVDYHAESLPGGVYIYRLRTEHGQLTRRFILLK